MSGNSSEYSWVGPPLFKDSTKTYFQSFAAQGEIFSIGECAQLRPSQGEVPYIGRIESLFENHADSQKFIVTCWFFWPEETATGRQSCDGENELFISTEVQENLLTAVIGKCFVMTLRQAMHGNYLNQGKQKNHFYTQRKYDHSTQTFQPLPEYKDIPKPPTPSTGTMEKILGVCDHIAEKQSYFIKWKDESVSKSSWVSGSSISKDLQPHNFTAKYPISISIKATNERNETRRYTTRQRDGFSGYASKWDLTNIVGSSKENVQYVPIQRIEKIMIPSWRIIEDGTKNEVPMEESDEDTTDEKYLRLHEETNELMKLQIAEALRIEEELKEKEKMDLV